MNNPFAVDKAFIVSVKALKRVLKSVSNEKQSWWVGGETRHSVTISQSAGWPWVAERSFRFPKVARIKLLGEDGEMVCIHPYSSNVVLRSMRVHEGKLKYAEDWEPFWEPIKQAIRREYSRYSSGGRSSGRSSRYDSSMSANSSSPPRRKRT